VVVRRGEIWWAKLPKPTGSGPGYRRPIVIVQADVFNESRIQTVIAVPLTSNRQLARLPGNVLLSRKATGLPKQSVANVSQIITLDKSLLTKKIRMLSQSHLARIEAGIRLVLSLE